MKKQFESTVLVLAGVLSSALARENAMDALPFPASRSAMHVDANPESDFGPVDAVLVVQNHASDEFLKPLSNLGDRISERLSGDLFNIIDPNDAMGDEQNRGPWGENMPTSAATRLAENLNAQALITAAVDEASVVGFGNPVRAQAVRMTLTLSAKRLPKGANVAAVTATETSRKVTPGMLSSNAEAIYSELVGSLVAKASARFLAKCEGIKWRDVVLKSVEVGFGCNFPGADVSIDGVSYGTAGTIGEPPLRVKVSDGLHKLKISYPFTVPYEVRARLQAGTTFIVVLRENDEGRRIRKEDAHFDALMDRIAKSGATDDQVRLLRARGYGKYLSSSHTRIEGMPQVLSMRDCDMPDFGLNPDRDGDGVETRTSDLLDSAGTAAGVPIPQRRTAREAESRDGDPGSRDGVRDDEEDRGSSRSRDDGAGNGREPPDNTDVGVAIPLQQQGSGSVAAAAPVATAPAATAPAAAPAAADPASSQTARPLQRNEALQNLDDIKEGVDTGKDIIQGINDMWNMLK